MDSGQLSIVQQSYREKRFYLEVLNIISEKFYILPKKYWKFFKVN